MHSAEVILPQFQNIEVGDAQQLGKNGPCCAWRWRMKTLPCLSL